MHQPCKSNTGKSRSYLPLSFAAKTALKASNQPKSKNQPRALSTTSVSKQRISFAASAAQLADSTRATKVKSCLQHLIRNRYYDPHSGRFTAEDPVRDINLYFYAYDNPVNQIDPSGLSPDLPSTAVYFICCLGGHPAICKANEAGGQSPPGNQDVNDCMLAHERRHLEDYPESSCICKGVPDRTPVTTTNKSAAECPAFCVELECLKKKPPSRGVRDRINGDKWHKGVNDYINQYCGQNGCPKK